MNKTIILTMLALLVSGCGKSLSRDEKDKDKPGYQEAKAFCAQCHALPFGDQHPPAAWYEVVARMEGHMKASNRKLPDPVQREAIITYFQNDK